MINIRGCCHPPLNIFYGQASRPISTGQLNRLLCLHTQPINVVVYNGPSGVVTPGIPNLEGGFPLRCFQRLSFPYVATQRLRLAAQLEHQRYVQPGPLVLRSALLKYPAPTVDRDQTVSRRFKPSSRTALIGEQPNPWDLLQPQDAMSRHRGAKPPRRCELLGEISLLSPEYLLSVERRPFHTEPPDHYDLLSYLLDLLVSQSSSLMPLHSTAGFQSA